MIPGQGLEMQHISSPRYVFFNSFYFILLILLRVHVHHYQWPLTTTTTTDVSNVPQWGPNVNCCWALSFLPLPLQSWLSDVQEYLVEVAAGTMPMNHQIIYHKHDHLLNGDPILVPNHNTRRARRARDMSSWALASGMFFFLTMFLLSTKWLLSLCIWNECKGHHLTSPWHPHHLNMSNDH